MLTTPFVLAVALGVSVPSIHGEPEAPAPRQVAGRVAPGTSTGPQVKPFPAGVFESPAVITRPGQNPVGNTPASPAQDGVLVKIVWEVCGDDQACLLDIIQDQLDLASEAGLRVALAVTDGPHTPPEVKDNCTLFDFDFEGEPQTMCLPWDRNYLVSKEDLVLSLGARFDSHPALAYVYFTGACSTNGIEGHCRVDEAAYTTAGYTQERLSKAYREILDFYLDAFPTTPVVAEVHALFGSADVWEALWQHGEMTGRLGIAAWWCSERLSVRGGDTVQVWPLVQAAAASTFAVCQPVGSFSHQPYRYSDAVLGLDYGHEADWDEDDVLRAFTDTVSWMTGQMTHAGQPQPIIPFAVMEPWSADTARDEFQDLLSTVGR